MGELEAYLSIYITYTFTLVRLYCISKYHRSTIARFTVVSLVTWPLIENETASDFVLIQTSLSSYVNAN